MPIFDCTLWEYFKNSDAQKRQILMAARFKIFEKTLSGLNEIQNRGFRHLDIKPGNIMLKTLDGLKNGVWNEQDLDAGFLSGQNFFMRASFLLEAQKILKLPIFF